LERLGVSWDKYYGLLQNFKKQAGHCRIAQNTIIDGMKIGSWVNRQRTGKAELDYEQIEKLNTLGFSWDPIIEQWEEAFAALQRFQRREGHCRVMNSFVEGGVRLGTWVGNQRARKSRLTSDQISQLDSLGFNWDPYTEQWEEAFAALQKFHKREGHCRVTVTHTEEGIKLGRWVSNQRHQNKGALTPAQLEKLKSVGFSWNPLIEQWEEGFEALQKFYKREGHSSVMATFMENGFGLGRWVVSQRTRKTRLTPEQINRLNSLEFTWDPLADRWGQAFAALQRFHKQEGHCRVAQTFQVNGLRLGTWVSNLRKIKDRLTPEQIKRLNSLGFIWKS
jgi:predicted GNAT family N-acyltransferase